MLWRAVLLAGLTAALAVPQGAGAQQPEDPDWPCVQRKVPSLTPAAIWTGPVVEEGAVDWAADAEIADLVARLSQRRLPLDAAQAEVTEFAAGLPPEERRRRLTLLFAGLFDTMNAERSEIMEGIERHARRLKDLAEAVRDETARIAAMRASAGADPAAISEAETALLWQTRVFNERRSALTYGCDVPRLVEQRLFALGRTISGELKE